MTERPAQPQPPPIAPIPPPGAASHPPPYPMHYATPGAPQGPAALPAPGPDNVQKVFDTVVGPNVRLMDNLVQLACAVGGAGIGALVGRWYGGSATPAPLAFGAIGGAIAGVFLSGASIGVVRFVKAMRKR
jgi:hypothetical protein